MSQRVTGFPTHVAGSALRQWGGPCSPNDELAHRLGFRDARD